MRQREASEMFEPATPRKANGLLRNSLEVVGRLPWPGESQASDLGTSSERPLLQFRHAVAACMWEGRSKQYYRRKVVVG